MNTVTITRTFAVALALVLSANSVWATGAEEAPAAAADKQYVTDPTTGKVVVAPQYGGTITFVDNGSAGTVTDYYVSGAAPKNVQLFMEKLGIANWAIDRDVWPYNTQHIPDFALSGRLAESWEQPDLDTIIFKIRQGVHWHDKPPMNGRELTAADVEWSFHRLLGLGSGFTDRRGVGQPHRTAGSSGSGGRFMAASVMVFGLTLVPVYGDRTVRAKLVTAPTAWGSVVSPARPVKVTDSGWSGLENGELLRTAAPGFDVFLTADQNLEYLQNLSRLRWP